MTLRDLPEIGVSGNDSTIHCVFSQVLAGFSQTPRQAARSAASGRLGRARLNLEIDPRLFGRQPNLAACRQVRREARL